MKTHLLLISFSLATIIGCQTKANIQKNNNQPASPGTALSEEKLPDYPYVLHKAGTRGETRTDWLWSKHTFSFNNYYNADRVGFGALLVINDDWVKAGAGFPNHQHEEMEIVSIPLIGGIAHQDSKGASGITAYNKEKGTYTVQHMTAGAGIAHSEYNASATDSVRFLQIWISPNKRNLKPAYNQKEFALQNQHNRWQTLLSPSDSTALFINQQSVFSMAEIDKGKTLPYALKFNGGVYAFVLEGAANINGVTLERRDGLGIRNTKELAVSATKDLKILLIEVPVQ